MLAATKVPIMTAVRIAILATSFALVIASVVMLLGTWGILARFDRRKWLHTLQVPNLNAQTIPLSRNENLLEIRGDAFYWSVPTLPPRAKVEGPNGNART
jgi:hypothetical protein